MIINKTDMSIGSIPAAVEDAIRYFLQTYPYQPVCSYEIILCDCFETLEKEWRNYYGYGSANSLPLHYDGQFLAPEKRADKLTILLALKQSAIAGAEQYYKEVRYGAEEPSEERGLRLLWRVLSSVFVTFFWGFYVPG